MARQSQRMTIYDMMDQKGVFDLNPANASSRDSEGRSLYGGPQLYPRMFYHPKGERRVVVPSEVIVTPFGPKEVGEKTEIVWAVAGDAKEEAKLRAEGWHDHPAKAMAAAGEAAPAFSSQAHIDDLERKMEELQKQLADALAAGTSATPAKGKVA